MCGEYTEISYCEWLSLLVILVPPPGMEGPSLVVGGCCMATIYLGGLKLVVRIKLDPVRCVLHSVLCITTSSYLKH